MWISAGAKYERHWAYEKPERPQLPPVSDAGWARNPIDRFILNKLDAAGLKPSGGAEPAVLMRRLYLDLIGIPPSPEQVDDFLASPTDEAYRAMVEELLGSPQYGEHWARHWLDLARCLADRLSMVSMVMTTELRSKTALRLCTINPRTTREDISETIRRLERDGISVTNALANG